MVQDQTGDKRLRKGMWEVCKGSLQEADSQKREILMQVLEWESSADARQQGAH